MKSQLITVLSVVGVVATAVGAMAINSSVLATSSNQTIGEASGVLVPVADISDSPLPTPTPPAASTATPTSTPTNPGGDDDSGNDDD